MGMQNETSNEIVFRPEAATLPVTATVLAACRLMRDKRVGAILVTEPDGRLAGMFTGRDAVERVLAEALDPATTPLEAVMTIGPDTLKPGARAVDALRMMRKGGYRHVPIMQGNKIAGLLSRGDFADPARARVDEATGFQQVQ